MTTGQDVLNKAWEFLGDPYVYGATGPNTFDCSGLMQYAYKLVGIAIPRTSEEQAKFGTAVSANELAPGDLVFAAGSDGTASAPGHVGMYAGGGQVIEAPHTGAVVRFTPLSAFGATSYRRIIGSASGAGTGGGSVQQAGLVGNLFSFPAEILNFFKTGVDDLNSTANFFAAFFKPSTYVRIGAGLIGFVFLGAGLLFLIREAKPDG
ncbi:C40 family peptidase [Streptomyces sp. NPDC052000]|uniref:C40 family peptidase n=1 Tax=Streptomyces sp. NPDC052000 TaxID=3155676 RepID=UPI00344BCA71